MKRAVKIPVTVKCRIGIDDQDPEVALDALARGVIAAGADALIVHARKAWLSGLSPKENRDIPPLDYDRVYRLKAALPDVPIIINGGIAQPRRGESASCACRWRDAGTRGLSGAVAAAHVDPLLFGEAAPHATMKDAFAAMMPYIERELAQRHAAACDHAAFRRRVSCGARRPRVPPSSRGAGREIRVRAWMCCRMRSR